MTDPTPKEIARVLDAAGCRLLTMNDETDRVLLYLAVALERARKALAACLDVNIAAIPSFLPETGSASLRERGRTHSAYATGRAEAFMEVAEWGRCYIAKHEAIANDHEIAGINMMVSYCVDLAAAEEEKT